MRGDENPAGINKVCVYCYRRWNPVGQYSWIRSVRSPRKSGAGKGAATGHGDGDGTNDMVLCRNDGAVTLLLNTCLSLRQPQENLPYHEALRQDAAQLTVHLTGSTGLLGSEVILRAAGNEIVARRSIGGNTATGCQGPAQTSIGVLRPGTHELVVRFSDGHQHRQRVELPARRHVAITIPARRP